MSAIPRRQSTAFTSPPPLALEVIDPPGFRACAWCGTTYLAEDGSRLCGRCLRRPAADWGRIGGEWVPPPEHIAAAWRRRAGCP